MLTGTEIIVDNVTAAELAHAAAQLFGHLVQGQSLSQNDADTILFHVQGMMKEGFSGSKSQWAIELATRAAPAFGRRYPDYRELLIKYMRSCIECEGSVCIQGEDHADSGCTSNADIGISPEEYAELEALAEEARKRSGK